MQQQRDEQPADAAVAVEERMDRLELDVGQPPARTSTGQPVGSSCRNRSSAAMQSATASGGGGTKSALPGRVPPIQFCERRNSPGSLSAPRPRESSSPCISRISRLESGKPLAQAREAVLQRGDVVRDLDDVVERHAGRLVDLEQQQIRERGLRAFDLRREHRFSADVGVEEELGIRQQGRDAVEAAAGEQRALQEGLPVARGRSPAAAEGARDERPTASPAVVVSS